MSKRFKPGKSLGLGPPEGQPWIWITKTMLGSITMRALDIHARRILDFLMHEHVAHGGRENGNLAAPYKQLRVWGLSEADVRKGLEQLYVTGFVILTKQGLRVAGGAEPSRYALTWLPTFALSAAAMPPSHDWMRVIERLNSEGIGSVRTARAWLRAEVADVSRYQPAKTQRATSHMHVALLRTCVVTPIK